MGLVHNLLIPYYLAQSLCLYVQGKSNNQKALRNCTFEHSYNEGIDTYTDDSTLFQSLLT